jgi:signal transduction histidine kinase
MSSFPAPQPTDTSAPFAQPTVAGIATGTVPPPPPMPAASRRRRNPFRALFELRTWKETAHLLLNLPLGITWFTAVVTMLSVSFGMMITLIGFPLLLLTVIMGRWIGIVERLRASALLDIEVPGVRPLNFSGTWGNKIKTALTDRTGWKGLVYGLLMLPWGIAAFTVTVVVWSVALSFVTLPTYGWALPVTFGDTNDQLEGWAKAGAIIGIGILGVVLVAVAPWVTRAMAVVDRRLISTAFAPDRKRELSQRVEQLTESRDASVEGSAQELRRIERDLHDGAQQRLVGLAMELGLAKERLQKGEDTERALESVTRAHDEAKGAIGDLRNLVRGIHPAVLTDRGLDAALSAVAARSPIPVDLDVELPNRPPPAVEAAAYFVVSEALANVTKHAQASCASVKVSRRDGQLYVRVADDGRGGAVIHPGGGLAGLRDRVLAVEGRFRIASPEDGPTLLEAVLPCGS